MFRVNARAWGWIVGGMVTCAVAEGPLPQLKDPTRPAGWGAPQVVQQSQEEKKYHLSYLLVSTDRRQAIVNGKQVKVGEWVDGARVEAITEQEVRLRVDGVMQVLAWPTANVGKSLRN